MYLGTMVVELHGLLRRFQGIGGTTRIDEVRRQHCVPGGVQRVERDRFIHLRDRGVEMSQGTYVEAHVHPVRLGRRLGSGESRAEVRFSRRPVVVVRQRDRGQPESR